jgi:hypothetical protein
MANLKVNLRLLVLPRVLQACGVLATEQQFPSPYQDAFYRTYRKERNRLLGKTNTGILCCRSRFKKSTTYKTLKYSNIGFHLL